jgi:MFS family permease
VDGATQRPAARAWVVLALLTAIYALNFADRQLLAVLLDPVKGALGASDAAMGWLTGPQFAVFYTFAGVAIARAADRGRRWTVLAIGLVLWSAMTAASGLVETFAHLAAARLGVGIGEAACTPAAHSLISDLFAPAKRATAIAIYSSGVYLGSFLAFEVGGGLYERHGWPAAFFAFGAAGLVLAPFGLVRGFEPERSGARERVSTREALRELLAKPEFRHVALGAALNSLAGYALLYWVPAFFGRVHGMGPEATRGELALTYSLGGALGTFGGGWLADRLARRDERWRLRSCALATLAGLPFLYAFLFAESAEAALLLYAPAVVLGTMYLAPSSAIVQSIAPARSRATASAVLLFSMNLIGLGLGPWLAGALSDAFAPSSGSNSVRTALAIVSAAYLWGAAHLWRASRGGEIERFRKTGSR